MSAQTCEAVIVHCSDFGIQQSINDWLTERFGMQNYDRISCPGGIKDFSPIQGQIESAYRLDKIKKVIFIGHENCDAYGSTGPKERHVSDLAHAERMIKSQYSDVDVEKYHLHLDGEFEKIA